MRFRPCIDIHQGQVKQIVGSTLSTSNPSAVQANFISKALAADFATMYRDDELKGGHLIMLDNSDDTIAAAFEALEIYRNGLHVGGGMKSDNGKAYLDAGAEKLIVSSFLFSGGLLDLDEVKNLARKYGKKRLVFDLSCRKREKKLSERISAEQAYEDAYYVVINKWQTFTDTKINAMNLDMLSDYCSEFLVHGVDQEGKKQGLDTNLVALLAETCPLPVTYAGGISSDQDIALVGSNGKGKVDFTVGSSLDIFGGNMSYRKMVDIWG